MSTPETTPAPPGTRARLGEYELIDRRAVGGVAEIYRARHTSTGELVVIKRMRPDLDFDPEKHAGFMRELQLALLCKHKNLIRGVTKGTQGGVDYGVLEYIDGQDLAHVCARAKQARVEIAPELAVHIVCEILDGLDFAWKLRDAGGRQLGLVHRDLSPKNVFLRYDGQVRVGDFGSSLASLQERADNVVGTAGYMSPEQASLKPLDARSDLFAAGVVLFELLTSETAFDLVRKSEPQLLKLHQKGQIKAVPLDVPDELKMIIEIATSPDPDDRYASARDMKKSLERTEYAPMPRTIGALSDLLRSLFRDEYAQTRL